MIYALNVTQYMYMAKEKEHVKEVNNYKTKYKPKRAQTDMILFTATRFWTEFPMCVWLWDTKRTVYSITKNGTRFYAENFVNDCSGTEMAE